MRKLQLVLCGLSEEYKLDKVVEHLIVPVDTWFDWSKEQREDYTVTFNAMSVDDTLQGKVTKVVDDRQAHTDYNENKELSIDAVAILKKKKQYKDEVVKAAVEGALALLNLPEAIQQKPTLDQSKAKKVSSCFPGHKT